MKKVFLFMLLLAGYGAASAQNGVMISTKEGWHKIGETKVDFKTESDEITVVGADRFSSIKIKVTEAPINLVSFVIYFENGTTQSVKIGMDIKNPGETKEIKLDGGEQDIQKISFVYKTVANAKDQKAHLELWGYKPAKKSDTK